MKNHINTFKRNLQVQQGAYDGRFRQKRVEDKKKVESKYKCRKSSIEY